MEPIDSSLILTSSSLGSADLEIDEAARGRFAAGGLLGAGADFATGRDRPLSFPRLATPTPQVNCVLYPEHSLPTSRHWEQYGRRRSHLVFLLVQAKQSSEAPLAGALRRRFRWGTVGGSDEAQEEGGHATGRVILTARSVEVSEASTYGAH
jgi:hypothetical protein